MSPADRPLERLEDTLTVIMAQAEEAALVVTTSIRDRNLEADLVAPTHLY